MRAEEEGRAPMAEPLPPRVVVINDEQDLLVLFRLGSARYLMDSRRRFRV